MVFTLCESNCAMKKRLLITLVLLCICAGAFSTAQIPDKIIYQGKEYALHSNPLEKFFDKYPERRPRGSIISTALWRGYVATFEVKDGQLFLKDIEIMIEKKGFDTEWKSVLEDVFPGEKEIKITWLTGLLVIPDGELINYVHMGYASTYERYILLEVYTGNLKAERKYDHNEYSQFRERQFKAFRETPEYLEAKQKLMDENSSEEFVDSFLRDFVVDYTSKILVD